jgi:hypothetical protein
VRLHDVFIIPSSNPNNSVASMVCLVTDYIEGQTLAQNAYTGQLDPSTGQSDGGALWIYGNLQRLATFDIRQYPAPVQ